MTASGLGNISALSKVNIDSQTFAGDGVTTDFTLTDKKGEPFQVDIGGQLLRKGLDWIYTDNVITFAQAPGADALDPKNIQVFYTTRSNRRRDLLFTFDQDSSTDFTFDSMLGSMDNQ